MIVLALSYVGGGILGSALFRDCTGRENVIARPLEYVCRVRISERSGVNRSAISAS